MTEEEQSGERRKLFLGRDGALDLRKVPMMDAAGLCERYVRDMLGDNFAAVFANTPERVRQEIQDQRESIAQAVKKGLDKALWINREAPFSDAAKPPFFWPVSIHDIVTRLPKSVALVQSAVGELNISDAAKYQIVRVYEQLLKPMRTDVIALAEEIIDQGVYPLPAIQGRRKS